MLPSLAAAATENPRSASAAALAKPDDNDDEFDATLYMRTAVRRLHGCAGWPPVSASGAALRWRPKLGAIVVSVRAHASGRILFQGSKEKGRQGAPPPSAKPTLWRFPASSLAQGAMAQMQTGRGVLASRLSFVCLRCVAQARVSREEMLCLKLERQGEAYKQDGPALLDLGETL